MTELSAKNFPYEAVSLAGRWLNLLFGLLISLLLLPMIIAIVIAIKLSSNGPVIFRQERIGLLGKSFIIYKFRSRGHEASAWRFGEFLRRTCLDEVPQLWNVIRGDMSLVGPRPHIPQQVENYQPWQCRRLLVKPGITGPRQIKYLNRQMNFNERIELDLEYIDNYNTWLDIRVLMKTALFLASKISAKSQ